MLVCMSNSNVRIEIYIRKHRENSSSHRKVVAIKIYSSVLFG